MTTHSNAYGNATGGQHFGTAAEPEHEPPVYKQDEHLTADKGGGPVTYTFGKKVP